MAGFAHIFGPPELYPSRGYALVEADWLPQLFVRPAAWGTGVAAELHDRAIELGARKRWMMGKERPGAPLLRAAGLAQDGRTRVVPFPPHPTSLGYSYEP